MFLKGSKVFPEGFGVKTEQDIKKRDRVMVYEGELLTKEEGLKREAEYEARGDVMGYTFWFPFNNSYRCLDATNTAHISRFINHSKKRANLVPRLVFEEDTRIPRIVFKAKKDIPAGEELLFDYGEDRDEVLKHNPWLKE